MLGLNELGGALGSAFPMIAGFALLVLLASIVVSILQGGEAPSDAAPDVDETPGVNHGYFWRGHPHRLYEGGRSLELQTDLAEEDSQYK